jgi:hypothetical protein
MCYQSGLDNDTLKPVRVEIMDRKGVSDTKIGGKRDIGTRKSTRTVKDDCK